MEGMQEARSTLEALDPENNKSIDAKEFLAGTIMYLPEPYLILRDSPVVTHQNVKGITSNNLAAVMNILAREHNTRLHQQHVTITQCMSSWKKSEVCNNENNSNHLNI
jgi:hypothetical protein